MSLNAHYSVCCNMLLHYLVKVENPKMLLLNVTLKIILNILYLRTRDKRA